MFIAIGTLIALLLVAFIAGAITVPVVFYLVVTSRGRMVAHSVSHQ